ncbi:MAG: hypothetical protein ISS94_00020 [Candidatus Syntrophoarchaeum sp.]|nr:hypothetical protein [Candidatus Syntrophoarchaeum sp.]
MTTEIHEQAKVCACLYEGTEWKNVFDKEDIKVLPSITTITITSPTEGDEVSWRYNVEGSSTGVYGSELNVYVLIYPLESNGPWWVQPPVILHPDGNWEASCYFGRDPSEYPEDIGDYFKVCAIVTTLKLEQGQQWYSLPDYVVKSEIVQVRRK